MTVWNDSGFTQRLAHASWMANVAVLIHHNRRATGDPAREWLGSWARRWFVRDDTRVLVLGCGEGWLERSIAHWPFIASIHAVDFAAEAVERARELAPAKITYGVADLNRDELPVAAYDIVIAHAVLHHVENLEHAYAQIQRTLRDDGTLIINEYVGPNRFQYSDRVLGIMNAMLRAIGYPERVRPTVEEMIANDPTEAVRASELLDFTARFFDVVDQRNIGGTILQHLLYEIAPDFRFDVPVERSIVELLCEIEAMLIDAGEIPCDFVLQAARKRGAPRIRKYRELVPRSEDAKDVDPDPLGNAGALAGWLGAASAPGGGGAAQPAAGAAAVRMLRIVLASMQPHRRNLFKESRLLGVLERFRSRPSFEYADRRIRALLDLAATLAPRA